MFRPHALIALAATLFATTAAASEKPRVAVLYFDNDTGDKSFDPLQKGFADMLITDLAANGSMTVVERDRLKDILAELKLQRSRYFDKSTAIKIGKGLGAEYALTGSFVAVKPKVRINTRLIEIKTGTVVFGTKVVGAPEEVFELEQQLVANLLKGLEKDATATKSDVRGRIDIDTFLEYSKGIDLVDRGDIELASKKLDRVISLAPTFTLARIRRKALIKSYRASQERKEIGQKVAYRDLRHSTEKWLKKNKLAKLDLEGAQRFLSYRIVRGQMILHEMRENLTPAKSGAKLFQRASKSRKRALALADEYYRNTLQLLKELEFFYQHFTKTTHGYAVKPSFSLSFDDSDKTRMQVAHVSAYRASDRATVLSTLARFVLLGDARPRIGDHMFRYAPPLAKLDPKRRKQIFSMIKKDLKREDDAHTKRGKLPHAAVRYRTLLADYYFFLGDRESEVRELQQIIDRYPGHTGSSTVERRIEAALGLRSQHAYFIRDEWAEGLAKCKDNLLNKGRAWAVGDAEKRDGFAGIEALIKLVEKKCVAPGKKKLNFSLYQIYRDAALRAGGHGWCNDFERYIKKSVTARMPQSEADKWRENVGCVR